MVGGLVKSISTFFLPARGRAPGNRSPAGVRSRPRMEWKEKTHNFGIELLAGPALDFGPGGFQILGGPVRAVVDNRVQGVGNGDELAPAAFSAETSGTSSDKQAR